MKKIPVAFVALLFASATFSQLKLSLRFSTVPKGRIFISDYYNNPIDTVSFNDGKASISIKGDKTTLFYLVAEGYNYDRPFHFILSNEETSASFNTLIPIRKDGSYADLYPNYPRFNKDPNRNTLFYSFQKAL